MKKGVIIKKATAILAVILCFINFNSLTIQSVEESLSRYSSPKLKNKYQCINGPCWAFANISTLEAFLNKKGILKDSLSEKHLLSWANQSHNKSGWHISISQGASSNVANGYLTSGFGPVFEKDCLYNTNDTQFDSCLSKIKPRYWVKGIKNIDVNTNSIKKAISEYGAVTIIYPINNSSYHAVSAIGWNDKNKKWLVKDSAKSPSNYTWLPYSTKIIECSCITDAEEFSSNQKIYQHDLYGISGNYSCTSKVTAANVFEFNGNEVLDSITVYSTSDHAKITLYCAPTLSNGVPNSNKSTWKNLYSGTIPYKGYFTYKLNNKINLNKSKYAIIAQIEKTNTSDTPNIGCQIPHEKLTLENKSNKCFVLSGKEFLNINDISHLKSISAFSIKANTKFSSN